MDIGLPLLGLVLFLIVFGFVKLKRATKNRLWIFWIAIFVFSFLCLFGANEFFRRKIGGFAGSYPFVEYWEIKASETEITNAIKELSKVDPHFQPPGNIVFISPRDSTNAQDYWQYINLYYPDTKEIVHTWTRPGLDTTNTTFAFISLSKVGDSTDFRLINRDFWYIPNKQQIHKFKSLFVDRIQEQINKNRKID